MTGWWPVEVTEEDRIYTGDDYSLDAYGMPMDIPDAPHCTCYDPVAMEYAPTACTYCTAQETA